MSFSRDKRFVFGFFSPSTILKSGSGRGNSYKYIFVFVGTTYLEAAAHEDGKPLGER